MRLGTVWETEETTLGGAGTQEGRSSAPQEHASSVILPRISSLMEHTLIHWERGTDFMDGKQLLSEEKPILFSNNEVLKELNTVPNSPTDFVFNVHLQSKS